MTATTTKSSRWKIYPKKNEGTPFLHKEVGRVEDGERLACKERKGGLWTVRHQPEVL